MGVNVTDAVCAACPPCLGMWSSIHRPLHRPGNRFLAVEAVVVPLGTVLAVFVPVGRVAKLSDQ
jgi:hypothetical protein